VSRRPLAASGGLAGVAAVPLIVVLLIRPGDRSRALDVYVLFLGAVILLALARMTAAKDRPESPPAARRRPHPESARLPELARIEREVVLATGSEFDQHVRIKPLLRDVVEHRLWARRGVDLGEESERAQELLGPEVWELVRPEPPDPNSRYVRGLDLAALRRVLDTVESL
jgi:hypothetical protein